MSTEKKVWTLIIIFMALFAYGVYNIFAPDKFPMSLIRGQAREIAPGIIIGPYPTRDELVRLKKGGVKKVVSLLNESILIERRIIEEDRKMAGELGLEYVNVPLVYLDIESPENMRLVNRLVADTIADKGKKIYVHCYLGRHRVRVFEKAYLNALNLSPSPPR
ncbi:MAG: hypothetical protein HZB83_06815 [Deltaproteobacteria bacterium]|nr:hypothetical protein [Deltaproteobacteria bacterium]